MQYRDEIIAEDIEASPARASAPETPAGHYCDSKGKLKPIGGMVVEYARNALRVLERDAPHRDQEIGDLRSHIATKEAEADQ